MKTLTLDIVEQIIKKVGVISFDEIIKELSKERAFDINDKTKATIFTDLNIEKRFVHLGGNNWDLRANHPYAKVHLPLNELYEIQKIKEDNTTSKLDDEIKSFIATEE